MKVKNISVKPICIGSISLLPGETAQVDATYDDAMAFYISMGLFQEVQGSQVGVSHSVPQMKAE